MNTQFVSIVVMIVTENIGWTKIYIATRRIGLKGSSAHRPSVALNLKISFPLLITTKVCEKKIIFFTENNVDMPNVQNQKQSKLKIIFNNKNLIAFILIRYFKKYSHKFRTVYKQTNKTIVIIIRSNRPTYDR